MSTPYPQTTSIRTQTNLVPPPLLPHHSILPHRHRNPIQLPHTLPLIIDLLRRLDGAYIGLELINRLNVLIIFDGVEDDPAAGLQVGGAVFVEHCSEGYACLLLR